jgi:hypothetical protein
VIESFMKARQVQRESENRTMTLNRALRWAQDVHETGFDLRESVRLAAKHITCQPNTSGMVAIVLRAKEREVPIAKL